MSKRLCIIIAAVSYVSCSIGITAAATSTSLSIASSPQRTTDRQQHKALDVNERNKNPLHQSSITSPLSIPRGGSTRTTQLTSMIHSTLTDLQTFVTSGSKADTLVLLLTTALNAPLCQKINLSPILGFLGLGMISKSAGWIKDLHRTEQLADLGIVLFLFEMGLHLDLSTLLSMKRDVFGIGLGQFTSTALVLGYLGKAVLGYSTAASVIVGWSLALSSSAFVLQLLKDTNEMESQYGKSSFGTLLLQDLMVVPLLVITPLLAGTGDNGSIPQAIAKSTLSIIMALSTITLFSKTALTPLFNLVAQSNNNAESTIAVIFTTLLSHSFLTEGLGLSNTLGAFLSGMTLAETPFRHLVEQTAAPFRGLLVGIFFYTVGFEIDLPLIASRPVAILATVVGILLVKTILATGICRAFGLPMATSQRVGLVLSQGGEFAFVAFRSARGFGILGEGETKFLLTCVALTMVCTPFLEGVGGMNAKRLEEKKRKGE